jgi:predicted dehydrogenase
LEIVADIKPRLAFAGVGWIGRARMQALAEAGAAELLLMADPSEQCLAAASTIAPQARIATSFDELIHSPDIDGIVIATPSALHMDQATAALQQGKAVFCQKPLGRNGAEVAAVIDAAKGSNRLLGADFSYRYTHAFQRINEVIQTGELGKIFAVDLKFHNAYGPDKSWFYDYDLSGGGCALDLGIHLLDLMLYALGFPEVTRLQSSLLSKGISVAGRHTVEDYASVSMELENDITAQLACSWNLSAGADAIIEASFYGTNGGVSLKNVGGSFYDFTALRFHGTRSEILCSPPDHWGGKALLSWVQQLSRSNSFEPAAELYLKSAAILDKIYGTAG